MKCHNQTEALVQVLREIDNNGREVTTRGFTQKEILSSLITIDNPNERAIVLKNRNNNIFALIAETLWVLGGRNDLGFLSHYLPRAIDFSDDGLTWRAAYGPRLRNWYGIDQFETIIDRINEDTYTKCAVMTIFDPQLDFVETKDVPCNNWLHFMSRDNKLNLDVVVRANDAIWGFGGINAFEWSVLLQLMSYWTKLEVGSMTWYTSTMHVYSRHYTRYKKIIDSYTGITPYTNGFRTLEFSTPFKEFSDLLQNCFLLEKLEREQVNDELYTKICTEITDPMFSVWMRLLFVYNAYLQGKDSEELNRYFQNIPECDLKISALEFFYRKGIELNLTVKERKFFERYSL